MNGEDFEAEQNDPNVIGYAENEKDQQIFIIVAPGSTIGWERICLIETFDPKRVIVATPVETIKGIGRGPAAKKYMDTIVEEACVIAEHHFQQNYDPWDRFINTGDDDE